MREGTGGEGEVGKSWRRVGREDKRNRRSEGTGPTMDGKNLAEVLECVKRPCYRGRRGRAEDRMR